MSMNYLVAVAILSSLTIGSMAQKSQGISHYECKLNQEEDDLVIMLNIAVSQGDENCVRQVLKKGISPSARYDGDVTQSPIISAVFGNRLGIIDALFEAGLDPKSESVKLALFTAAANSQTTVLERLLLAKVPVDSKGQRGETPLMYAASSSDLATTLALIKY